MMSDVNNGSRAKAAFASRRRVLLHYFLDIFEIYKIVFDVDLPKHYAVLPALIISREM